MKRIDLNASSSLKKESNHFVQSRETKKTNSKKESFNENVIFIKTKV
jgi:hypothetical protein